MNIGDISEAKALAELTEHYKEVLEPFTDNSSYDYVADDGESFHKIQVKPTKNNQPERVRWAENYEI